MTSTIGERQESRRRRILLVEDEPALREQVFFLLEQEGYEVVAAENGLDALSKLGAFRPELILADVRMPKMDGFELCAAVRANSELAGVPFVFLTSRDAKEDRLRGRALGADDYLTKPFEVDELLAVLQSRIARTDALTVEAEGRVSKRVAQTLSHELKTPLTVIQGLAALLQSEGGLDEATQREFLKLVIENGELLNRHVDNLLALKQADGAPAPQEMRPLDLVPLVADVIRAYEPAAKRKRVALVAPATGRTVPIVGQRSGLLLLLTNLLDNAIKFTEGGGIVTVTPRVAPSGEVEIAVADTGIGIAPENLTELFRDFYREEEAAHTLPGTGLGLALCRRIAGWHGGTIDVESEKGRGTTVTVRMRATPPAA